MVRRIEFGFVFEFEFKFAASCQLPGQERDSENKVQEITFGRSAKSVG